MGDSKAYCSFGFGACCCVSACLFFLLAASLTTTYANKYEQESGLIKGPAELTTWSLVLLFVMASACFALGGCAEGGNYNAVACGVYTFIILEIDLLICGIFVSVSVSRNEDISSTGKSVGISTAVFIFCNMFVALSGPIGVVICIVGNQSRGDGGGGGSVTSRSYQPRHEETANSDHSLTEDQKRQLQPHMSSLAPEQRNVLFQYIIAKSQGENPKAPEGMTEEQVQIIIVMAAATN